MSDGSMQTASNQSKFQDYYFKLYTSLCGDLIFPIIGTLHVSTCRLNQNPEGPCGKREIKNQTTAKRVAADCKEIRLLLILTSSGLI